MALCTRIMRDGEPLTLPNGWGWWHVGVIVKQTALDLGYPVPEDGGWPERHEGDLSSVGSHTVTTERTWIDPEDGEVLTLLPGDVLLMWRD